MSYESLKRHLVDHNNCYVSEHPSSDTIKRLEEELNAKVIVRDTKYIEGGYVVEIVKEVK